MSLQPKAAVGAPLSRVDGRLKVTGGADYAADHDIEGVVHAVIVDASIGRGRHNRLRHRPDRAPPCRPKVLNPPKAPPLADRWRPGAN
ncbi:xanthine dehydrogenase family protein molybdopterin-binding subunit, partial [Streptomyces sp. NPDC127044]